MVFFNKDLHPEYWTSTALDVVCNPSTWKVEAGGLEVQHCPDEQLLTSKFSFFSSFLFLTFGFIVIKITSLDDQIGLKAEWIFKC